MLFFFVNKNNMELKKTFYDLPIEIQVHIYTYDNTYNNVFKKVLYVIKGYKECVDSEISCVVFKFKYTNLFGKYGFYVTMVGKKFRLVSMDTDDCGYRHSILLSWRQYTLYTEKYMGGLYNEQDYENILEYNNQVESLVI